jgi:hypothetical protein
MLFLVHHKTCNIYVPLFPSLHNRKNTLNQLQNRMQYSSVAMVTLLKLIKYNQSTKCILTDERNDIYYVIININIMLQCISNTEMFKDTKGVNESSKSKKNTVFLLF